MRNLGIILIIIGITTILITGVTYVTKKNIANIGSIEINKEESHPFEWSPLVGGVLLVSGIIALTSDKKKHV
jgi:hypothetical protein